MNIESCIKFLFRIIGNLDPKRTKEVILFKSVILYLNKLRRLEELNSIVGWGSVEEWKQDAHTLKVARVQVVLCGKPRIAWYFPKRNNFYWNLSGNGPCLNFHDISFVRNCND